MADSWIDSKYPRISLYAVWDPIVYSITYDLQGGTNHPSNPSSYTIESNNIVLQEPTKTGYEFLGWTGSNGSTAQTTVTIPIGSTGNKSYTTSWSAITYTVSYNGNGNTGGSTASSSHTYDIAKNLTANGFTKTGYTFKNWNTKADGTGTSYANSASVTNLTSTNGGTVTLYAQWTINTYSLTINPNGGTWGGTTSNSVVTQNYNSTKFIPEPSRDGYTFTGWSTSNSVAWDAKYGEPAHYDPTFVYSSNDLAVYNNSGGGTVSHTKTTDASNPLGGNVIKIATYGTASPGAGGYRLRPASSSPNSTYYQVLVAKIPVGYTLIPAYNSLMGGSYQWITSNTGTGNYETYVLKINTGSDTSTKDYGSWSYTPGQQTDFGYMYLTGYLTGSNNTSVTWYVAYVQTFNATNAESTYRNGTTGTYRYSAENQTLTANWRKWVTQYRCRYFGGWEGWNWDSTAYYGSNSITSMTVYRNWGSWSGWQNSAVSATSERQVQTQWIDTSYWGDWGSWSSTDCSDSDRESKWVSSGYWSNKSSIRPGYHCHNKWSTQSSEVHWMWNVPNEVHLYVNINPISGSSDVNTYYTGYMARHLGDRGQNYYNTIKGSWLNLNGSRVQNNSGDISGPHAKVVSQYGWHKLGTNFTAYARYYMYDWSTEHETNCDLNFSGVGNSYTDTSHYEYRCRHYYSQGYTQYRYRDLGGWTTTNSDAGQTGTQYNHRTPGDWTSWSTTDCSSGYYDRQTQIVK